MGMLTNWQPAEKLVKPMKSRTKSDVTTIHDCKHGYNTSVEYALPPTHTHTPGGSGEPGVVASFLAATARGYEWGAAHPAEAAALLLAEVERDTAPANGGVPLPAPLKLDMLVKAQVLDGGRVSYVHFRASAKTRAVQG
jgi:ABC-type nitrate/sulfonate/bicarbonate transport system substrate-binding protein